MSATTSTVPVSTLAVPARPAVPPAIARTSLLARLWRAAHRPPAPPAAPGIPLVHNVPQQFGQSFRYPDGTWFHCC